MAHERKIMLQTFRKCIGLGKGIGFLDELSFKDYIIASSLKALSDCFFLNVISWFLHSSFHQLLKTLLCLKLHLPMLSTFRRNGVFMYLNQVLLWVNGHYKYDSGRSPVAIDFRPVTIANISDLYLSIVSGILQQQESSVFLRWQKYSHSGTCFS